MASAEFWYEFASTYSYPAALRVAALADQRGVSLIWRPFLLGPIFMAQGWRDSPFNIYPVKGRYMWRDLARICAREGLPLRQPSAFPRGRALSQSHNQFSHPLPSRSSSTRPKCAQRPAAPRRLRQRKPGPTAPARLPAGHARRTIPPYSRAKAASRAR